MRPTAAAPTTTRRPRSALGYVVVGLAVAAAILGALAQQPSPTAPLVSDGRHATPVPRGAPGNHGGTTSAGDDGAVTEKDGVVPDGVTAFDEQYPGVANLDADLLRALRRAASDAAGDGVTFYVNSGWRSPGYQDRLFREAVSEHGSAEEAARWVATPDTSAHVSGDAVDIGSSDATAWLSEHGSEYGLCQTYGNEPWHYELRPGALGRRCPQPYPDPTHDPRMQRR